MTAAACGRRLSLITVLCLGAPMRLLSQCPDGTPPPCANARAGAPAARTPDPGRIVIMPFRVTTADTLFGEGLAELLSNEFTSASGPRPVLMGTVLRAWRRAGGGLRAPLSQPDATRLTADLGAGLYVDGSVVGVGPQLTISGAVLSVPGGIPRRVPPVSGRADSLPALVERFAAGLLATAGVHRVAGGSARITDSPEAMRLYLEAMSEFRRAQFEKAATGFERAFAADPQFARAAYMRYLTIGWGPGFGQPAVTQLWRERTVTLRDRLSPQDQLVLEAALGNLATRERIAATNPELPEVWYYIGDSYYHNARVRGWNESMARARDAFERSLALDSQATVLHHLIEIGLWDQDTALLRSAWTAYDRMAPGDDGLGLAVASRLNDARLTETMRRRLVRNTPSFFMTWNAWLMGAAGVPAALVDELIARAMAASPPSELPEVRAVVVLSAALAGRPSAAARVAGTGAVRDTVLIRGFDADVALMVMAAFGDGDPVLASQARARVLAARPGDSTVMGVRRCGLRLADALRGDSVVLDDAFLAATGQRGCAELLHVLAGQRAGTLDSAAMARHDSIVSAHSQALWPFAGVGPTVLARGWELAGVRARALARWRGATVGFPDMLMGPRRVGEARNAAATGDTAGAIRAYREYLDLRRHADPVLVPQRDSAQAELDRLLGRGRPVP